MNNFRGYYIKIGNCEFNNPLPLRETYKFAPKLVQVGESEVLASGKLSTKVLPHTRSKLWWEFPPMTIEQFRVYYNAWYSSANHGMYLTVEAYDFATDSYITDTYYHTDISYVPITLGGKMMIKIEPFELIGH